MQSCREIDRLREAPSTELSTASVDNETAFWTPWPMLLRTRPGYWLTPRTVAEASKDGLGNVKPCSSCTLYDAERLIAGGPEGSKLEDLSACR